MSWIKEFPFRDDAQIASNQVREAELNVDFSKRDVLKQLESNKRALELSSKLLFGDQKRSQPAQLMRSPICGLDAKFYHLSTIEYIKEDESMVNQDRNRQVVGVSRHNELQKMAKEK